MQHHDLVALEGRELDDGTTQITRALDLDDARPIEVPGGDVVFVTELARTDDDQALHRVGDLPIASTSVYDREQLTDALLEAEYPVGFVEFATETSLGDSGPLAAHLAESRDHDHPAAIESAVASKRALTDGGEPSDARRTSSEQSSDDGDEVDHTPRTESVCFDCGASYPTSGSCDCGGVEEL
ncbi:hypothetical protein [Halococcus hamelinensis]|uniref:Uncharacterized protein n=1 Tax=Halococcus hamelinensis 100A6 TaxID=1132509 RepID=M0LZ99_9EURY|nr:hypothetical protein [Halococcus hamelinensis]EMA38483.1 hypothetical protein C447_10022 [Halococcus hamelinensis 100A6]